MVGDVRKAVDAERRLRPWAQVLMFVLPLVNGLVAAATAAQFRSIFEDLERIESGDPFVATSPAFSVASSFGSLVQLGGLVVIGLWAMRTAEVGKAAGRPARRSPGWALGGFFVPVVNFWFPYVSIVESLAPSTKRGPVLAWWLAYLLSAFGFLAIMVAGILDVDTAVLVIAAVALAAMVGVLGISAVRTVADDHDALLGGPARP